MTEYYKWLEKDSITTYVTSGVEILCYLMLLGGQF
jgi:hypothetical protein